MKNTKEEIHVEEDEKHLLLDHNYDGIQELNHPLPSWWSTIWGISIVFAFGYFVYYQFLEGPTLTEEFHIEYKTVLAKQDAFKKMNAMFSLNHYQKILSDGGVKKGAEVYELNCLPCHAENGKGDVGPNLTDDHWIIAHGTPETVYDVVFHGSEANGMPIWSEMLSKDEIYQAVAYVMTFKNTFLKGKGPEGVKFAEQ